ncbi:HopJ type III effector protein [Colwelliaceae bacterium BS250]
MSLTSFLTTIKQSPETVSFTNTMQIITDNYIYSATAFSNGDTVNLAATNEGSCKIFAFAQLHNLTVEQTLNCFGDYYRVDVLQHPDDLNHANIRNFITHGWQDIAFESQALQLK